MRRHWLLVVGLPSLALGASLAACDKGTPSDAIRTDSAGIEIVTGPATDRPLAWPVVASDTLYDPATDTILSGEARWLSLGADGQGGIVIGDGGFTERRVLRRDSNGAMHQIGRRGGGPGEYQRATRVAVSPEGEVLVADFGKRAFVRFGPDDAALDPVPWSAFGTGVAQDGGFAGGGIVVLMSQMSESASVRRIRHLAGADTLTLSEIHDPAPKELNYEKCGVMFMGSPLFTPALSWTGNREQVAVTAGSAYEIVIWRGGRPGRIVRRTMPPRAATEALARQDVGEGHNMIIGGRPCLIPGDDIVAQQGFAATLPMIKRITMAADGTLWVERYTVKGEPLLRDVFDPTGGYLGTLTGDVPWPQAWLPDGQFVAVGADADSLPVVVRYAVGGAVRRE